MSFCGPPKKCCSCSYTPPTQQDECRCGCGYRNGVFQILCAQFLLFCAFWFGMATIGDCAFVEIESPIVVRQDGATATRLGMLGYTQEDGSCYYWTDTIIDSTTGQRLFGDQQAEYYFRTVLGPGWYAGIFVTAAAVALSFLLFLYATSFCCSTQVLGVRMFVGLFLSVVLVILQGLSFLILSSQWCADEGCVMDRSAAFSIAAACCLFLSGTFFFFMSNYPGKSALVHQTNADMEAPPMVAAAAAVEEGGPKEMEPDQEGAFPEDDDEYPAPPSDNGGEPVDENEKDPTGETEKSIAESGDTGDDEETQEESGKETDVDEPKDGAGEASAEETTTEEPQGAEPAGDEEAPAETKTTEDESPATEEPQVQEDSAAAETQHEEAETDPVLDEELEPPPSVPAPSTTVS